MTDARSITVLIIDDNPVDRQIYRRMLEASSPDYRVYEAADGAIGIEAVHLLQPDCVLLDAKLTDQSGFEVLVALVGEPENPAPPVIMLTGSRERVLVDGASDLGAYGYLIKGCAEASELDRTIRGAVGQHAVRWSASQQP